jgi:3,4-dihydroxy 2-butanone 4-phosphate synthase/GTP cyclohydrolase II
MPSENHPRPRKRPPAADREPDVSSIGALEACLGRAGAFRRRFGRPFIVVSYAQSVDGSIAMRNRHPIRLSSPPAMRLTHRIRACCDAILVGIGTVLTDDPSLTARFAEGGNPQPVVLDTRLRTPLKSKLVQRGDLQTWIVNGCEDKHPKKKALMRAGATPVFCSRAPDGRIDLAELMTLLADRNVDSVMVEGGAKVITSFMLSRLVDQFVITVAPKLAGGLPVVHSKFAQTQNLLELKPVAYEPLGEDVVIWGKPVWT